MATGAGKPLSRTSSHARVRPMRQWNWMSWMLQKSGSGTAASTVLTLSEMRPMSTESAIRGRLALRMSRERISGHVAISARQARARRHQYDPDKREIFPESGDERRTSPTGLPWFTSPWDVRLVERVRLDSAGTRSTASIGRPRALGGSEVVVARSLTSRSIPRLVLALLLAALSASACGGDDTASPTTTTSSSTTTREATSTTTAAADEDDAAVRTAYEAASQAFIEAAAIPDPDHAALAATHTGPMLEQRRETLLGLQADGRVIRYPTPTQYRIEISSVEVEGDVARLIACVVDDGERVDAATGTVIASGVGTVEWRAAMRRVDGRWLLAERLENERWEGVAGCAAE